MSTYQAWKAELDVSTALLNVFSHNIARSELEPGDHIYSWRAGRVYSHHGIYVGDGKVINFNSSSKSVKSSAASCQKCGDQKRVSGVKSSCIDCFLHGGELYRYQYGVSSPLAFRIKGRGCCTFKPSDPAPEVIRRAEYMLQNGFRGYDLFNNNCEDFALYCKTETIATGNRGISSQGNAAKALFFGSVKAAKALFSDLPAFESDYSKSRCENDIAVRTDKDKISVEDLVRKFGRE